VKHHLPGETSDECDELVKILRASPANCAAAHDDKESEHILLPLDIPVCLATSSKETVFHDSHSREELEGHGKQDRERIEELHRLREARRRVEVLDDDRVDFRPEREIGECAGTAKKDLKATFRAKLDSALEKTHQEGRS
jgi:hypothetical protein